MPHWSTPCPGMCFPLIQQGCKPASNTRNYDSNLQLSCQECLSNQTFSFHLKLHQHSYTHTHNSHRAGPSFSPSVPISASSLSTSIVVIHSQMAFYFEKFCLPLLAVSHNSISNKLVTLLCCSSHKVFIKEHLLD